MRRVLGIAVASAALLAPASVQALPSSPGFDDAQALAAFVAQPAAGARNLGNLGAHPAVGASATEVGGLEGSEVYEPLDVSRLRPSRLAVDAADLGAVRVNLGEARRALTSRTFDVPTPDGGIETFEVRPTQVMESGLAKRHPELRTYVGTSRVDPSTRIAVTVTPLGLNASVVGDESWVVEPAYDRAGTTAHAVVRSEDLLRTTPLVEADLGQLHEPAPETGSRDSLRSHLDRQAPTGEVELRTYRLALLNDPSYADYFGTENVLAQKVTLVNRVNQLYDTDFGIRFVLIDETEQLNLDTEGKATGTDGPCGGPECYRAATAQVPGMLEGCGPLTIGRTRAVLGQLVGADAYDVGHLVLGNDAGGVAYLGVAGRDYAGAGCTGLDEPRGDVFYVDYVSHELGHQFAANHTFDGSDGFCGANGTASSVEPGSGSSVMGYAGICGSDDLQPHTDPAFSQHTIDEVGQFVSTPVDDVVEVQHVSLSGFDGAGDTITIGFGGETRTLTRGSTYSKAGLTQALRELTGGDVAVSNWGFDPYLTKVAGSVGSGGNPDDRGFQVAFSSSRDPEVGGSHEDVELLTVVGSAGVTAQVGETAQGGPARNGGTPSTSGNTRPVVTAPPSKTIPVRTPFRLEGSATDADGDPLTYSWEQDDPGIGTGLFDNDKRFGPLFRIFGDNARVSRSDSLQSPSPGQNQPSGSAVRHFPDLVQVVHGRTNAASGRCPRVRGGKANDRKLDCYSEFLPTKDYRGGAGVGGRTMHFRLTARDASPEGGGTAFADVRLKVRKKAGPFLVTSQNDGDRVRAGSRTVVTWKVNRTRKLAKKVRILLSTDDGATFNTVLANNTRNDGKARVRIPSGMRADRAWIMVEARGNYFFDVNGEGFRIR